MSDSSSQETPVLPSLELFSLKGQNAFITGGSRGIGAAIAVALAEAGASICPAQRDTSNDSTAKLIKSKGGRAEVIPCDLANAEDVKGIFQKALDVMGQEIHIMVNCGGLLKRKVSVDVSEADWDYVRSACLSFASTNTDLGSGDRCQSQSYFLTLPVRWSTYGPSTQRENNQYCVSQLVHRRRSSCPIHGIKRWSQSTDESPE
jgi:hypothetical protein